MKLDSIFSGIPHRMEDEIFETVLKRKAFKLERIVSAGHATPKGEWYDQDTHEWVIVLSGSARLLFQEKRKELRMNAGDYIHIRPHQRHRVEWTHPGEKTIWLALHFR